MPENPQTIQESLFLISPPGSKEAKDMGYINVPKIFKAPPHELDEVHHYQDQTGFLESPQESNFWVYRRYIEQKRAAFDLVVPLFPKMLKFAVPWIVCEYGLYCTEKNNPIGLELFTKNTIKRRTPNHVIADLLWEKRWRNAEEPIYYLKGALNQIYKRQMSEKRKKSDYLKYDDPEGRFTLDDHPSLFGKSEILSVDEPVITGDPYSAFSDDNVSPQSDIFETFSINPESLLIDKACGPLVFDKIKDACEAVGLQENAIKLLVTQTKSTTSKKVPTRSSIAVELGLSEREYETARKSIQRKTDALQDEILRRIPDLPVKRNT